MRDVQNRAAWLFGVLAVFLLITGAQMYRLSGPQSQVWRQQAEDQIIRTMPSHGPRGSIYDRKGRPLATSEPAFAAVLVKRTPEYVTEILPKLANIIARGDGGKARDITEKVQRRMKEQKRYEPITVANKLDKQVVAELVERRSEFSGVVLVTESVRNYPQGSLAGSVLGYVGPISPEELERPGWAKYLGATVGKDGLELSHEAELQGQLGERTVTVDNVGRPVGDYQEKPPAPGNSLQLSLDLDLQRVVEEALVKQIQWIDQQRDTEANPIRGIVVVQDVRTGAILTMASVPTFDPNLFVTGMTDAQWNELANHPAQPLQNWALAGFPPGSTYKMGVGLAGLELNRPDSDRRVIGPYDTVDCPTKYWRYHEPRNWAPYSQGPADVARALAISCDPYFYELGYRMTINPMAAFLSQFGFGQKTGVDLPGEQAGANPTEESYGKRWMPGNVLSVAIGQGDVLTTPLQLANYTATVARSGERYQPYLVQEVYSPGGELISRREPRVLGTVQASAESWRRIQEGMRLAVTDPAGTAHRTFVDFPIPVAAKTGSAETGYSWSNALTVAYAPYERPEIAVSVLVEGGAHGSWVAPVARAALAHYFGISEEYMPGRSLVKTD